MNNFHIETITPVHVGNGKFIQKDTEYILDGDKILVISPDKFMQVIGPDKIEDWLSKIENGQPIKPLIAGINPPPEGADISSRIIQNNFKGAASLPTLKEQISSGMGNPYIPGSSLKGSIRSAILASLIRKKNKAVPLDWTVNRYGKYSAEPLEDSFFGSDPNHDIFRFLRVGDSYFTENSTESLRMGNINLKGDDSAKLDFSKQQLTEAIGTGQRTTVSVRIDFTGMGSNTYYKQIEEVPYYFQDLKSLTSLINKNTKYLIKQELDFWEEYEDDDVTEYINVLVEIYEMIPKLKPGSCILRVGHGMGWTFLSGNWMKDPALFNETDFLEVVEKIRPYNNRYEQYPYPKTRRTSNEFDLLGFVKLTPVEEAE